MLHTKGPILEVFEITLGCSYSCSWGYPQVNGLNAGGQQIISNGK
jgi:hypothetical protein